MTLQQRFAESGEEPVSYGGILVHRAHRVWVRPGDVISVEFEHAGSPRPQGLCLGFARPPGWGVPAGLLEVNRVQGEVMSLWYDSAPRVVTVACVDAEPDTELEIWNQWQEAGTRDFRSGNAGMVVEPDGDDAVVLRCSDGPQARPSFDSLVVRLVVTAAQSEAL